MNLIQMLIMKMPGFMSCRELDEKLDEYVAGDLTLVGRFRFAMHFAVCKACAAYAAGYKRAVDLVKRSINVENVQTADEDVPEDLIQDILQKQTRGGAPGE